MNDLKYAYMQKTPSQPSCSGRTVKERYTLLRDGNNYELVYKDSVNIQEEIDSYLEGTSLPRAIQRFLGGDETALSQASGFFGDVSGYEKDPALAINNARLAMSTVRNYVEKQQQTSAAETKEEEVKTDA